MDELKDETKIELKETASPQEEATSTLVPSPNALPVATEQSKFKPTQTMVSKLTILRQGSWFAIALGVLALLTPQAIRVNFLIFVWIAICAELFVLASVSPSHKLWIASARNAAISVSLTVLIPLLILLGCAPIVTFMPAWLLSAETGMGIFFPIVIMYITVPVFGPIALAILTQLKRGKSLGLMEFVDIGVFTCLISSLLWFFTLSPAFLIGESWYIPGSTSIAAWCGFISVLGLSYFIHQLLTNYIKRLKLEVPKDKSKPSLP